MLKMIITDAVVSKGFDDKPAVRVFAGDNGFQCASFRIGKRVYDSRAEGNHRWINFSVKGFGPLCERVKKMTLKEGSFINLVARYDEESWEDKETGERRTAPVLILDEIEYCFNGGNTQKSGQKGSDEGSGETKASTGSARKGQPSSAAPQPGFYPPTPQEMPYPPAPQETSYPPAPQEASYPPAPSMPGNFTGFENYGGQQGQYF